MNTGHSLFELGCMSSAVGSMIDNLYVANVMNRLRELINPHESDCKRWIWELIQNAKDSVNGQDRQVNIKIVCNNKHLIFEHDGSAFNAKALLGLLYKFSHGKSKTKGSTGRFGTGFLTTHSLSKIVHIESDVINDSDGKEDIKGFSATMYRDGLDESSLLVGVEKMKKSMIYKDTRNGFTRFTYDIIDQHGLESLSLGISNFEDNISHTLLFCPEIGAISLDNGGVHSRYRIIKRIEEGKVYHYTLEIDKGGNISYREFLMSVYEADHDSLSKKYCSNRRLLIECVVEVLNGCVVQRIETVPSIFCVFPLVGSEYIRFPFVLNSRDFEPTTERQGLLLIGSEFDDKNSVITPNGINRDILRISIDLYCRIIEHLSSNFYKELHLLSYGLNSSIPQQPDLDSEWYRCYQTSLCELLKRNRIVLCNGSYVSINEKKIIFIDYCSMNSKDSSIFHGILRIIYGFRIGDYADSLAWSRYLFSGIEVFSLNSFCSYLSEKKSIQNLESQESLHYNEFLRVLFEHFREQLNHYSLLPNQNGRFVCFNSPKFYQEKQVRDGYKHLYNLLGNDWKEEHLDIGIDSVILANVHDERSLCNFLSNSMKDLLEKSETLEEFHGILGILSNDKVYDSFRVVVQRVYEKIVKIPIKCVKFPMNGKQVFGVFDSLILKKLLSILSKSKRYDSFLDESLYCEFLEHCIRTLPSIETDSLAIYSNQVGDLKCKKDLYLDTWIPEHLKDSLKSHNYDIRSKLLLKSIQKVLLREFPMNELINTINKCLSNPNFYPPSQIQKQLAFSIICCLPTQILNPPDNSLSTKDNESIIKPVSIYDKQNSIANLALAFDLFKLNLETFNVHSPEFWEKANSIVSKLIYEKITKKTNINQFGDFFIPLISNFLNHFPNNTEAVYPNSYGTLMKYSQLYNDKGIPSLLLFHLNQLDPNKDMKKLLIKDSFNFIKCQNIKNTYDTCKLIDNGIKELFDDKKTSENLKISLRWIYYEWFPKPDYSASPEFNSSKDNNANNHHHFQFVHEKRADLEFNIIYSQPERDKIYEMITIFGFEKFDLFMEFERMHPGKILSIVTNMMDNKDIIGTTYRNSSNRSYRGSPILSIDSSSKNEKIVHQYLIANYPQANIEYLNESKDLGAPYDIVLTIPGTSNRLFIDVRSIPPECTITDNHILFADQVPKGDQFLVAVISSLDNQKVSFWRANPTNEPLYDIETKKVIPDEAFFD